LHVTLTPKTCNCLWEC